MPKVIGARLPRLESEPLLRGHGRFVGDIEVAGALHVAFVRSPHPHAVIRAIDRTAALAVTGVHAVLTLDDLAKVMIERRMVRHSNSGMPLDKAWLFALADGEASYVGEPVAMVVAETRAAALDAADLVIVDYEELPTVVDLETAMQAKTQLYPDAPGNLCVDWPGPVADAQNEREVADIIGKAANVARVSVSRPTDEVVLDVKATENFSQGWDKA